MQCNFFFFLEDAQENCTISGKMAHKWRFSLSTCTRVSGIFNQVGCSLAQSRERGIFLRAFSKNAPERQNSGIGLAINWVVLPNCVNCVEVYLL